MITKDFHGFKAHEAENSVHAIVAECRSQRKSVDVELIVGHGVIRTNLLDLLKDYGLNPTIKIGNSGVIKCLIE